MRSSSLIATALTVVATAFLAGCPLQPRLGVSMESLRFGKVPGTDQFETMKTFEIFNDGHKKTELVVDLEAAPEWISVASSGTRSTGPDDPIEVTVTIDRDFSVLKSTPNFASGSITITSSVETKVIPVTTAPDFFTQSLSVADEIAGFAFTFREDVNPSFFTPTKAPVDDFPVPTDEAAQFPLDFGAFGDPIRAGLFGTGTVPFYGVEYEMLYISSQGWVSFGEPGNVPATAGDHFAAPQISMLPVDATAEDAVVSYQQTPESLVITYEDAPTAFPKGENGTPNDFQIEVFFDGTVQLTFLEVDPAAASMSNGVLGLSAGTGQDGTAPEDFIQSDFIAYETNTAALRTAM